VSRFLWTTVYIVDFTPVPLAGRALLALAPTLGHVQLASENQPAINQTLTLSAW